MNRIDLDGRIAVVTVGAQGIGRIVNVASIPGKDIAVNCVTPATAKTRFLKVEKVASMIAWLCSAENSFSTGAVFDLSGDRATY